MLGSFRAESMRNIASAVLALVFVAGSITARSGGYIRPGHRRIANAATSLALASEPQRSSGTISLDEARLSAGQGELTTAATFPEPVTTVRSRLEWLATTTPTNSPQISTMVSAIERASKIGQSLKLPAGTKVAAMSTSPERSVILVTSDGMVRLAHDCVEMSPRSSHRTRRYFADGSQIPVSA